MKKTYEKPTAMIATMSFEEHIIASGVSESSCHDVWVNVGELSCTDGNAHWEHLH